MFIRSNDLSLIVEKRWKAYLITLFHNNGPEKAAKGSGAGARRFEPQPAAAFSGLVYALQAFCNSDETSDWA